MEVQGNDRRTSNEEAPDGGHIPCNPGSDSEAPLPSRQLPQERRGHGALWRGSNRDDSHPRPLALLIWIVTRSEDDGPSHPKDGDKQVIGIMVGMFLVGLYIGPDLNISLDSDLFGLAFLVIPAILIAPILLPDNSDSLVSEQEEE